MPDAPNRGEELGETRTYLERVSGGGEFRSNPEMQARFFDEELCLDHDRIAFRGKALTLDALGRPDLLKTKLFAYCDRAIDRLDCIALQPSAREIAEAQPWVIDQDTHPQWPEHVHESLATLAKELEHGV